MSNFTTKGISENGSKYISPGIRNVKITSVESKDDPGTSPAMFLNFEEIGTGKTLNVRFIFSEKGAQYSLRKLKHLQKAFVTEETIDAISDDVKGLAIEYGKILNGKEVRIKFNGEEVLGREGKSDWIKATVAFPPFCELLSVNPTRLTFDPNRDVKRLETTSSEPTANSTTKPDSVWTD